MSSIKIYGKKGMIVAKPFQINSADDDPEVITSEEEISSIPNVSDSDKTESTEVATDTGNQGQ